MYISKMNLVILNLLNFFIGWKHKEYYQEWYFKSYMMKNVNCINVTWCIQSNTNIYNVIDLNLSSSSFLIATLGSFAIFSYRSYENGGLICRPFKSLTRDIAVNVIPCLSCVPILIVTFYNVNPCDLWIVKPHTSFNGSCFWLPLSIGVIETVQGNDSSHGNPT